MDYGAIDLHTRRSQIRIVREDGTVILERRVDTTRAEWDRMFGGRTRMRILLESSTESEWVAPHLEGLGHEVVVADPNYAAMYGSRSRKVKTDRRDVAALAEANRTGVFRRAHRVSAPAQELREQLRVRAHAVRMRAQTITVLRSLLRRHGLRLATGAADHVLTRLDRMPMPAPLAAAIAPLRTMIVDLNRTVARREDAIEARATDARTQQLMTAPGVGPIVALTFQAVLDTP